MTEEICVDASVAVKWIQDEEDTDRAIALHDEAKAAGITLVGPPHLAAEVTSAVHRGLRLGQIDSTEAARRLGIFEAASIVSMSPPGLLYRAAELAHRFGWRLPYDAFYLALGEALDCDVWTADRPFYVSAREAFPRLHLLADYPLLPDSAPTRPTG